MPRAKSDEVTPEAVREYVRRIAAQSRNRDSSVPAGMEYSLYRAVLARIALGGLSDKDAQYLAMTALQSQQYGFERNAL